jgi:secreted PhoX family phosphatase
MNNEIEAKGTLANCSGGVTPWGTILSGEENFQDYPDPKIYRWLDSGEDFIKEHYGWMVEVNPFDRNYVPKKRTSLGRFRHENIAFQTAKDGRVVAYMGDDKIDECVYKFITKNKYRAGKHKSNEDLLDGGDLYAADFGNNKWVLLDYEKSGMLKKNFKSQADILVNCDKAAKIAGGTPCNRCEDIEINTIDKTVFMAFTNSKPKNDFYGSIVRIIEKNGDHTSMEFDWEVFATGGVDSGFSCPDNLYFDSKGNLWVLCDVSAGDLNKGVYAPFKNNSLFMIPTAGDYKGKAFRFASGPVDTEMCGTCFTPDESTMFMSIQHPGEGSLTIENPTSRWPDYGNELPKPAVVAVTGFK